jgi:hypothetical protein
LADFQKKPKRTTLAEDRNRRHWERKLPEEIKLIYLLSKLLG